MVAYYFKPVKEIVASYKQDVRSVRVNTSYCTKVCSLIDLCCDFFFVVLLYVLCLFLIGVDSAEALDDGGRERDAGRATHILHPLHLPNAPLEYAEAHNAAES